MRRSVVIGVLAVHLIPVQATAPPESPAYVGAETCGRCHTAAFTSWAGGDHSRAALVFGMRAGREMMARAGTAGFQLSCRACHAPPDTVAPISPDGSFRSEDGVQCETCHGPGSLHVQLRTAPESDSTRSGLVPVRADTAFCLSCHRAGKPLHDATALRTPRFDKSLFWKRIQHRR